MSTVRLFVYGSLKRGFRHHGELAGAAFVAAATTAPGHRLVRYGDYPALVRSPGGATAQSAPGQVQGEVYSVPEALLPRLDDFEECPTLYQRETIELSDGTEALAYVITRERAAAHEVIVDGRWREDAETQRSDMGL